MINVINFINVIIMVHIFNIIVIVDFFAEDAVLNVNVLNFSAYSTR